MLGLKHNVNVLVDYDSDWEIAFRKERKRIEDALGDTAKGIEHYGSTSIIGLRAKPILDILVGVAPFDDWAKCRAPLEQLGYDYAPNAGVPGNHMFGRGRDLTERTHLVHVVEYLGEHWSPNLAFRDALRTDSALRLAYLAEKERAIAAAPEGRAKYNALKHAFIAQIKAGLAS